MAPTDVQDALLRLSYVARGRMHTPRAVPANAGWFALVIGEDSLQRTQGDTPPALGHQRGHPPEAVE